MPHCLNRICYVANSQSTPTKQRQAHLLLHLMPWPMRTAVYFLIQRTLIHLKTNASMNAIKRSAYFDLPGKDIYCNSAAKYYLNILIQMIGIYFVVIDGIQRWFIWFNIRPVFICDSMKPEKAAHWNHPDDYFAVTIAILCIFPQIAIRI